MHDVVWWHGETARGHSERYDASCNVGYRAVSISIYGRNHNDPRFSAVMMRPLLPPGAVPPSERGFFGYRADHLLGT